MNSYDIGAAVADRFTGITVGGKGLQVGPTALLPNTIAKGPALLVFPPTGTLEIGVSQLRRDELVYPVRLLLDPLDVKARTAALYAWYDAMRGKVEEKLQLGLSYVAWARPESMRAELDGETYAGSLFDVVELLVRVKLFEHVSTIAV